jgi:hypothetical protein
MKSRTLDLDYALCDAWNLLIHLSFSLITIYILSGQQHVPMYPAFLATAGQQYLHP